MCIQRTVPERISIFVKVARKGLPKRSQRINDTLARSLHFSVILQGLEGERYRINLSNNENVYIFPTSLTTINDKQDLVQNRDFVRHRLLDKRLD